jgi:hypothetical protein
MKRIRPFLFFLLFAFSGNSWAQPVAVHDSTNMVVRSFSEARIKEYKASNEFMYGKPQQGSSLWQRFLFFIVQLISRFINFTTNTFVGRVLLYSGCIILLLYVIFKLLDVDARNLFSKSTSRAQTFAINEENIHALDFDKLIDQSVQKKEYRVAVRLTFLFALKKLADANLIKWVPGKTNDDYLLEIKSHPTAFRINELRYYFEYAWYGHFEIDSATYATVAETFKEFSSHL